MFMRFLNKEAQFFDFFNQSAHLCYSAALELQKMLQDLDQVDLYAKRIKDIEHQADAVTHKTIALLHKTFITPIDREDIHLLITEIDDVTDFIEAASQRIFLYEMKNVPAAAGELASLVTKSVLLMKEAIVGLSDLKKTDQIIQKCVEINRIENESDQILRSALAHLFKKEADTRRLIQLKELYEILETATDRCEDVANTIEGIILEYA